MSQNRALKMSAQAPPPPSRYSGSIVMLGVIVAVLVVPGAYWILNKKRKEIGDRMILPEWKAGESLATNFTTINSAIGIAATASLLPVTKLMQKAEYTSLFLLFSLLVALAPLVLQAIRLPSQNPDQQNKPESYVWLFLISSLVTLLGMVGHIPTEVMFLEEFHRAHLTSKTTIRIFQGLIILFGFLLLIHSIISIRKNVRKDELPEAPEGAAGEVVNINKPLQAGYWL